MKHMAYILPDIWQLLLLLLLCQQCQSVDQCMHEWDNNLILMSILTMMKITFGNWSAVLRDGKKSLGIF